MVEALLENNWARHLVGPVSMPMLFEFNDLYDMLEDVQLEPRADTFDWRFTADHQCSVASAYGAMFLGSLPVLGAKQIWKTAAPPQVCFFSFG